MNDDGTMARLPDLVKSGAAQHDLKIATIADLISYRRRSEKLVRRVVESDFASSFGGTFRMIVYTSTLGYAEHIALVKGIGDPSSPTLVRMQSLNLLADSSPAIVRSRSQAYLPCRDAANRRPMAAAS